MSKWTRASLAVRRKVLLLLKQVAKAGQHERRSRRWQGKAGRRPRRGVSASHPKRFRPRLVRIHSTFGRKPAWPRQMHAQCGIEAAVWACEQAPKNACDVRGSHAVGAPDTLDRWSRCHLKRWRYLSVFGPVLELYRHPAHKSRQWYSAAIGTKAQKRVKRGGRGGGAGCYKPGRQAR